MKESQNQPYEIRSADTTSSNPTHPFQDFLCKKADLNTPGILNLSTIDIWDPVPCPMHCRIF